MAASLKNPELLFSVAEVLDPQVSRDPFGTKFIYGSDVEGNRVSISAKQATDAVQYWEIGIRDPKGEPKGSIDLVLGGNGRIENTTEIIDIKDAKGDRFVIGPRLAAAIYHNNNGQ